METPHQRLAAGAQHPAQKGSGDQATGTRNGAVETGGRAGMTASTEPSTALVRGATAPAMPNEMTRMAGSTSVQ